MGEALQTPSVSKPTTLQHMHTRSRDVNRMSHTDGHQVDNQLQVESNRVWGRFNGGIELLKSKKNNNS